MLTGNMLTGKMNCMSGMNNRTSIDEGADTE